MDTSQSTVRDRQLERHGKQLGAPGRWFMLLGILLAVPGIVFIVLAHSWAYELGWVLFALGMVPAVVAIVLLGSSAVARWAARHKPFA
jgi:uncharacterized membrane protein HdeD (DUF308 family)